MITALLAHQHDRRVAQESEASAQLLADYLCLFRAGRSQEQLETEVRWRGHLFLAHLGACTEDNVDRFVDMALAAL